jgi:hypothetical protein
MPKMYLVLYSIGANEEFSKSHILIGENEEEIEDRAEKYVSEFNNGLSEEESFMKYGYNICISMITEINSIDGYNIIIGEKI